MAVLEQLETMTREGLTLSPETIAAMGRTEGRKSRWRTLALWIIAADLYRDSVGRPTILIAMRSFYASIAVKSPENDPWPA